MMIKLNNICELTSWSVSKSRRKALSENSENSRKTKLYFKGGEKRGKEEERPFPLKSFSLPLENVRTPVEMLWSVIFPSPNVKYCPIIQLFMQ